MILKPFDELDSNLIAPLTPRGLYGRLGYISSAPGTKGAGAIPRAIILQNMIA